MCILNSFKTRKQLGASCHQMIIDIIQQTNLSITENKELKCTLKRNNTGRLRPCSSLWRKGQENEHSHNHVKYSNLTVNSCQSKVEENGGKTYMDSSVLEPPVLATVCSTTSSPSSSPLSSPWIGHFLLFLVLLIPFCHKQQLLWDILQKDSFYL